MATPSKLKPGAMVRRKGEPNAPILTFVARHGSKYCRCQCDRYKGLDGPDDAGFVDVSDWDMARKYERVFLRLNSLLNGKQGANDMKIKDALDLVRLLLASGHSMERAVRVAAVRFKIPESKIREALHD